MNCQVGEIAPVGMVVEPCERLLRLQVTRSDKVPPELVIGCLPHSLLSLKRRRLHNPIHLLESLPR